MIRLLSLAITILCGSAMLMLAETHAAPAQSITNNGPVDVLTAQASMVTVPTVLTAVGHMRAMQAVDLSFEVSGHLTKISAENGHRVEQGEAIAQLDDQSDLAQLTSLQAAYQLAESNYERTVKLKQYGDVSAQELQENEAKMVAAKSSVEQQQVLIARKTLVTPFSGVLGSFQYSVGAYLPAGTPLVRLVQEAPLLAEYSVPANERQRLEIGQEVLVTASAYPDKTFHGILDYISPDVTRETGTLLLQTKVDNNDYLLLPGMFVNIKQILNPNRQLLMVPDIALMTDIQGEYVFKVTGLTVQKVYVKIGLIQNNLVSIKSGLSTGDIVVVAGQQKLVSGDTIHILNTPIVTKSNS